MFWFILIKKPQNLQFLSILENAKRGLCAVFHDILIVLKQKAISIRQESSLSTPVKVKT